MYRYNWDTPKGSGMDTTWDRYISPESILFYDSMDDQKFSTRIQIKT